MKEIKRYTAEEVKAEDRQIMGISKWCCRNDVDELITDHKAVVETMQNAIDYQKEVINIHIKEHVRMSDKKDFAHAYKARSEFQAKEIINMQKRIDELELENKRIKTAEKFSIDWDAWYMSLEYLTIDKTIKVFQAREMSTSNNYTCTDFDGNEHHTRECIRLPEGLIEEWITKFDN